MIINIGIDIVEKYRIKKLIHKYKKTYIKKKFSCKKNKQNEKKYIENLSKIFTIKEALVKAFGCGFRKDINFRNIKILKNNLGKPMIKNYIYNAYISLSHEKNITISIILIIKN